MAILLSVKMFTLDVLALAPHHRITACRNIRQSEHVLSVNIYTNRTVRSRTSLQRKKEINDFSEDGKNPIIKVPGHTGTRGNERAVDLAVKARGLPSINLVNPKPFGSTQFELREWASNEQAILWYSATVGRTAKILWGDPVRWSSLQLLVS